jgi:DNA-directed RNA polymerase specialized sigma24 family protein
MGSRQDKRTLTAEEFGKFLRWLSVNDEMATREYQVIRTKLIRYFTQKGCPDPDALFDKTVDIVVGKMDTCEQYSSPLAYCYGVAKNVWRQDLRERRSVTLDESVPSPAHADAGIHEQELKCLEECLDRLPPSERDIVIRYHQGQSHDKIETRKRLADGLGGLNVLRIKMCRIRKHLRVCVAECVQRSAN